MKVVIADDHGLVREGMAQVLTFCEGVSEVLEAESHADLWDLIETHPDIKLILLDINMAELTTAEMIADLKIANPPCPLPSSVSWKTQSLRATFSTTARLAISRNRRPMKFFQTPSDL